MWTTFAQKQVKGCTIVHILRQLRNFVSPEELHEVYRCLCRAPVEYTCPVFVGLNKKLYKKLKNAVKRAHRIINYGQKRSVCTCSKDTSSDRRWQLNERLFNKLDSSHSTILKQHMPRKLPNSGHYTVLLSNSDKYRSSFFLHMTIHVNASE